MKGVGIFNIFEYNMEFTISNLTVQDLEKFRDEQGFIDLDAAQLVLDKASREKRGDTQRIKNWVDFSGEKVLVKAERMLEGERNFGIYSELIMEELAKQMGLESARYDLIKYQGSFGVLSHMMVNPEIEQFDTVYALIGDTEINPENPDISDYIEVERKLKKALGELEMNPKEIKEVINQRRKQKILQLFACEADGHIENEGVIRYKTSDGRTVARMAPMFDNEASFLLDMNEKTLEDAISNNDSFNWCGSELNGLLKQVEAGKLLKTLVSQDIGYKIALKNLTEIANTPEEISQILTGDAYLRRVSTGIASKVAFFPEDKDDLDYAYPSMTDKTLAFLRNISEYEEDIEEFFGKVFEELDIKAAIENVERKIKAPMPDIVKKSVTAFSRMRRKSLDEILTYQLPAEERRDEAELLNELVSGMERKTQSKVLPDVKNIKFDMDEI